MTVQTCPTCTHSADQHSPLTGCLFMPDDRSYCPCAGLPATWQGVAGAAPGIDLLGTEPTGEDLAVEGMTRARDAADADAEDAAYLEDALAVIGRLARRGDPFTADDVRAALPGRSLNHPTALGSLFRQAREEGKITATGSYRQSTRPAAHGRPQREWIGA